MKRRFLLLAAAILVAALLPVSFLQAQTNTRHGFQALFGNPSGTYNTGIGFWALRSNTSGTSNSALGAEALFSNTSGGQNTASGRFALYTNTTGWNNTATGVGALYFNTSASNNTADGVNALYYNSTGYGNTASGANALYGNTTGFQNTAIGFSTLYTNRTGVNNTAVGFQALASNNSSSSNTGIGARALYANTSGGRNTAVGNNALEENTSGTSNAAFGSQALQSNTTGDQNTAVGRYALFTNYTAGNNTAVGYASLLDNIYGDENTAMGHEAMRNNRTGYRNTAVGRGALNSNFDGHSNIAIGYFSLPENNSGIGNVAVGIQALGQNVSGVANAAFGHGAGFNFNPAYCTFIGNSSGASIEAQNSTAIGYAATVTASDQVRIGNTSVTSIGGQVEWTTFSDGRYKQNVKEDVPGLAFVNKLRPVTYTLDVSILNQKLNAHRSKLSDEVGKSDLTPKVQNSNEGKSGAVYTGFVAQEVEKAAQDLNFNFGGVDAPKNKEDFYGLRYAAFVVPLVKAVQELNAAQEQLQQENAELRKELNELKDIVGQLLNGQSNKGTGADRTIVHRSGAYLEQNQPNPFDGKTVLGYYIPDGTTGARIVITSINGQVLKSIPITGKGKGQVTLPANTLAKGSYIYTLWANGEKVDSKKMMLLK
jgi:trimeric autotransporter adhesin